MRKFITGSDAAFQDLEQRVKSCCVVFQNRELPPGCTPARGAVAFDTDTDGASVLLLVQRGVQYTGPSREAHDWIIDARKKFPDFVALKTWLRTRLVNAYPPLPCWLTDLNAIKAQSQAAAKPPLPDENALFSRLAASIRGQDFALRTLARRVCRHLSRQAPRRPLTLMLLGPTGCGKTESARRLAEVLRYGDRKSFQFLRLDMCEFGESHRVSRLLGAPPSYVGYGDGSELLDTLSADPHTVVLFDEIEKAHPDVLKALMNAMDAGRLGNPSARLAERQTDCRLAIFLFTSNAQSEAISAELEKAGAEASAEQVNSVCRRLLAGAGIAPEIVARVGSFLFFRALDADARAEAAVLAIVRLGEEYGVKVAYVEPAALVQLIESIGPSRFGVRPLEYAADDLLGECLAQAARDWPQQQLRICGGPPIFCRPVRFTGDEPGDSRSDKGPEMPALVAISPSHGSEKEE